jgi:hypothetical protein
MPYDTCTPTNLAWNYGQCRSSFSCSSFNGDCSSCLADSRCGWCDVPAGGGTGSGYCDFGTAQGPYVGCMKGTQPLPWWFCTCNSAVNSCTKGTTTSASPSSSLSGSATTSGTSGSSGSAQTATFYLCFAEVIAQDPGFISQVISDTLNSNGYPPNTVSVSTSIDSDNFYQVVVVFTGSSVPTQGDWDNLANNYIAPDLDRAGLITTESALSCLDSASTLQLFIAAMLQ